MTPYTIYSFMDELEKIAIGEGGAATFKRMAEKARQKGTAAQPGFLEGVKRNVVATGRRFMHPKQMLKRTAWSLTGPGVPLHMKALAGLGVAASAAHAIPAQDPSGEGKSRIRRALEGAGGVIGGTAGRGITGGLIGGTVGGGIGSLAGKAIDKLRGYKPPPQPQE